MEKEIIFYDSASAKKFCDDMEKNGFYYMIQEEGLNGYYCRIEPRCLTADGKLITEGMTLYDSLNTPYVVEEIKRVTNDGKSQMQLIAVREENHIQYDITPYTLYSTKRNVLQRFLDGEDSLHIVMFVTFVLISCTLIATLISYIYHLE